MTDKDDHPYPERLLLHADSYAKIEGALRLIPNAPEICVIDDAGHVAGDGPITIAWGSNELFMHYGGPAWQAFAERLHGSPPPRWMQSAAAGLDSPMFRPLLEQGTRLTTSHVQAEAIAEYVMATILDHFQRGPERRAAQVGRLWTRLPFREIGGTRWLIIGFGAIGQAVAQRAKAFGVEVTAVRRNGHSHRMADHVIDFAAVPDALPGADVVLLALPLSAETQEIADTAFFAAMRAEAVFVNVGRGGLVDEAALLRGLHDRRPGHAILDVFVNEPLDKDSAFWASPRVTLTAHGSAMGSGTQARGVRLFLDNLGRYLAGEPLLNEVGLADLP